MIFLYHCYYKTIIMKNLIIILSLIFAFNLNANTDPNDFETLKQLEGKWVGTLERTNETSST